MDRTQRLAAIRQELRNLRARYQKQPISGNPGTLGYCDWRDTRGRIVTARMLVKRALRDIGYNPYASKLGWIA